VVLGVCQEFEASAISEGDRTGGMMGSLEKGFIMAGLLAGWIPREVYPPTREASPAFCSALRRASTVFETMNELRVT
jgi:hypothetical protein